MNESATVSEIPVQTDTYLVVRRKDIDWPEVVVLVAFMVFLYAMLRRVIRSAQ